MDDHWPPSLPPIRTSSYNARVSCETLNILPSHAYASRHSHTPPSSSQTAKETFKSVDTTSTAPASTSCSRRQSHPFASCFPYRFSAPKHPSSPGYLLKRSRAHAVGGAFEYPRGLLRSFCGFPAAAAIPQYSSPMAYASGVSPSHRPASSSAINSPSGRMGLGGTTPVMRSSKGLAAHAFTMMPLEVVGKNVPPDYEPEEPTSPEVTCLGRVRRKQQCSVILKEKHKNRKKKGKVKKLTLDTPHKTGFAHAVKRNEANEDESIVSAKSSKQRSERVKLSEFEDFHRHNVYGDMLNGEFVDSNKDGQGGDHTTKPVPIHADKSTKVQGSESWSDGNFARPPDCLLLMKKSRIHR